MRERENVPSLDSLPDCLTIEEFAAVGRMGVHSAYEAVRQKKVCSVRLGRRVLIPKAAVRRLLAGEAAE